MREALRRADNILARCRWLERRPTGRHHADLEPPPRPPNRRRTAAVTATAAVIALAAGVGWVALTGHTPAPVQAAAAATIPADKAEQNYLAELQFAGLTLTDDEQTAAIDIAREHVAHGHLIGMRIPILTDFEQRIPRLTPEQRDIARIAVEHHFLAVTGRKQ